MNRYEKLKKLLERGYYDGKEDYVDRMIKTYLKAGVITQVQADELALLNRPVVVEDEPVEENKEM